MTNIPETPPYQSLSIGSPEDFSDPALSKFSHLADPVFTWGECDSSQFIDTLNAAFAEAVHWKLKAPYGKAGKSCVSELARLFSTCSALALKAATLMPILLLQKPARKSKAKDHITCLE